MNNYADYNALDALQELLSTGRLPASMERDPTAATAAKKAPIILAKKPAPQLSEDEQNMADLDAAVAAGKKNPVPARIQREAPIEVTAKPLANTGPIYRLTKENNGVDSPTSPYAEAYRQTVNPALQAEVDQGMENRGMADEFKQRYLNATAEQRNRIAELDRLPKTEKSPWGDQILSAKQNYDKLQPPEPNQMANIITAVAPVLMGALGGEAGKRAALPAFQLGQSMQNKDRENNLELYKIQKSGLKDTYGNLISAEKNFNEAQMKQLDLQFKAIQSKIASGEKLTSNEQALLERANVAADKSETQATGDIQKGAGKISDLDKGTDEFNKKLAAEKEKARLQANKPKAGKPPTEAQAKAAMNANMMHQSEDITKNLYQGGVLPSARSKFFKTIKEIDIGKFGSSTLSAFLEDQVRSKFSPQEYDKIKKQIAAEVTFLEGVGRVRSGAAISVGEWTNFRRPYYDDYGDSPEISMQKRRLRESEMRQTKLSAGNAPIDYEQTPQGRVGNVPAPATAPAQKALPKAGDIYKGHKFKGGDPGKQENWEQVK